MFCKNCGHEIQNASVFCPECGAKQHEAASTTGFESESYVNPANQSTDRKPPYNTMCIIGLVISGISLLLNFWGLVGIAGTIISVLGLIGCEKKNENGKPLAIIGIAIGVFSIIYGVIGILSL